MREIKFRAWDKLEKRYVQVSAIDLKNKEFLEVECEDYKSSITLPKKTFPEHFILEQQVCKDKHGKDVYENSEIKGTLPSGKVEGQVIWSKFDKAYYLFGSIENEKSETIAHIEILLGRVNDIELINEQINGRRTDGGTDATAAPGD